MKFKNITNTLQKLLLGVCVALAAGFVTSCNDEKVIDVNAAFDPNQPVVVSDFAPKTAGQQEQILVYGSNFGNDKDRVKLFVGGKEAVVVNVNNTTVYGFVPVGAKGSSVEVALLDENGVEVKRGVSSEALAFTYVSKIVVGTLCGYRNENDTQGEVYGYFRDAEGNLQTTGFRGEGCLVFDPMYPHRLYGVQDGGGNKILQLDLEKRTHTVLMPSSKFKDNRLRTAAFTLDNQYMIVAQDRADNGRKSQSLWIVTRNSDGTFSEKSNTEILAAYKQCNGVAVHPVNGEVYFNSYENGQLFRLDIEDYFRHKNGEALDETTGLPKSWTGYLDDGCFEELFQVFDPGYEFNITIHPTGNYAYLNIINQHYIIRTDYDWKNKRFTAPYLVAGKRGGNTWKDAVGGDARVNRPYQGIFVKNPDYAGRADEYDYYFCDCWNYCVRYITPDGIVRTFAGRSPSTDNNIWGTEDGDLRTQARFRDVSGLAYDEKTETFYVFDHNNRSIRTIGKEAEEEIGSATPEIPSEGGEENAE